MDKVIKRATKLLPALPMHKCQSLDFVYRKSLFCFVQDPGLFVVYVTA